jgi:biopolymer transport protein ExbD
MGPRAKSGRAGKFDLRQNSEINVTPFVDVMLVLLIIFMVAAPLPTVAVLSDIPPPGPVRPHDQPPTVISLRADGRIYIDGDQSRMESLLADTAARSGWPNPDGHRILVRADRGVRYGRVFAVIDHLQVGGFHKVALMAEDL